MSEHAERTWLHRPGVAPRLVGIGDVGTEDWFYSRRSAPGELTLDDAVTAFEQDLGRDVAALRATLPGTAIESDNAARIVVHLVMRTAHLRRTMADMVQGVTGEIAEMFTDPARLATMMGVDSPMQSPALADAMQSTTGDLASAGIPAAFSRRLLAFLVRERGGELATQAVATLTPLFPALMASLLVRVRDSHNAMVGKPLDDHGWVAALSKFYWSVEGASDLILPDAVALAREAGNALAPLLFTSAADAELVLLPVSRDRMLVGRRDPNAVVDLSTFSAQAASHCQGFFIGARAFDTEDFSTAIGTGPAKVLAEAIAEAVSDAADARSQVAGDLIQSTPRPFAQQQFSYRVTLRDFGDDALAQEYAAIVQSVVGILSRTLPLHNLDGVTIAVDYKDALVGLDRGDPALPPAASEALVYGIGVACPVTVVRDGAYRVHLVLAAGIAAAWTSEDVEIRAGGLHLLIRMLAGMAHAARYADTPGFTPDAMDRELYQAVARSPCAYWSAKHAAYAAPNQGQIYAELMVDSLAHARAAVAAARARMTDDSDVGEAFGVGLKCVSATLGHAADWLGHRRGLPEGRPFAGDDLHLRLAPSGLDHWLELFGRDLAASYTEDDAIDLAVVTTLGRHVERLLWSIGIYCWPEGERVRCVVSDAQMSRLLLPRTDLPASVKLGQGDE